MGPLGASGPLDTARVSVASTGLEPDDFQRRQLGAQLPDPGIDTRTNHAPARNDRTGAARGESATAAASG